MTSTRPNEATADMITIRLDGVPIELPDGASLAELLRSQPQAPEAVATAVNGRFVPRDQRSVTRLRDGDQVLLFQPIVGG